VSEVMISGDDVSGCVGDHELMVVEVVLAMTKVRMVPVRV